jgi:hypothetical protein
MDELFHVPRDGSFSAICTDGDHCTGFDLQRQARSSPREGLAGEGFHQTDGRLSRRVDKTVLCSQISERERA